MTERKKYLEANRSNWDERVEIHAASRDNLYDVEGFLAGNSTLQEIELAELGDVAGKRLLHLLCHFGLDTLSWARLGAAVTGIDFSPKAVSLARELAQRSGLDGEFIRADVLDPPRTLDGRFQMVIASYGVLVWIPDMDRLMEVVSRCLVPGGTFLLVDYHPFLDMLEYGEAAGALEIRYPYFHGETPEACDCETSYVSPDRKLRNRRTYQWSHDLEEILSAALGNGMEITSLKEYPFAYYQRYPSLVRDDRGRWTFEGGKPNLPMLLSLKARKKISG